MSWFTTLVLVPGDTPDDAIADAVAALLAPYDRNYAVAAYQEDCLCSHADPHATPDPHCAECHGTGALWTTVNPQGYWESWTIGGGTCDHWLGPTHTMRAGDAAAAGKVPFALVTCDGRWQGGWHSPLKGEAWNAAALNLLRSHGDALAVACTLHD